MSKPRGIQTIELDANMPYSVVGSTEETRVGGANRPEQTVGAGWGQVGLVNSFTWMALVTQPEVHGICCLLKAGSCESVLVGAGDVHFLGSRNPIMHHFNLCYLANGSQSFDPE